MAQISFGTSVFPLFLEDITSELRGTVVWCFFYCPPDIIWFNDDFPVKVFLFWKEIVKRKKNQMLISVHIN